MLCPSFLLIIHRCVSIIELCGAGQNPHLAGVVIRRDEETLTIRDPAGTDTIIVLTNKTRFIEKESGRAYAANTILRGLEIEIEGHKIAETRFAADIITFAANDLRLARILESRLAPFEERVSTAETRLSEAEQNSQKVLGQLDELAATSNAAKGGVKVAQQTADAAVAGVDQARERISRLEERIGEQPTKQLKELGALRSKVAQLEAAQSSGVAPNPSPEPTDVFEYEYNRLGPGLILFDPPEQMTVGIRERVTVRIAKAFTDEMLSVLRNNPTKAGLEKVGTTMKVQLKGEGQDFEIASLNSEEQGISDKGFTEWAWNVLPNDSGDHRLYIVAVVVVKAGDKEKVKDYPSYQKMINVRVNPVYSTKRFLRDNWTYILSTIVGSGVIGLALGWWRRVRKKQDPPKSWENP